MNRFICLLFVCTQFGLVGCEAPEATTDATLEVAEDRGIPSDNPEGEFNSSPFSEGFVTDGSTESNEDSQPFAGSGDGNDPGGNDGFGGNGGESTGGGNSGNDGTAPVEDTGWSCSQIFDEVAVCGGVYETCLDTCQDQACADQCYTNFSSCADLKVADGTVLAQSQYNDMTACEQTNYDACYGEGGVVYEGCAGACADEACAEGCNEPATAAFLGCLEGVCGSFYSICGVDITPEVSGNDGTGGTGGNGGGDTTVPEDNSGSLDPGGCGALYDCEDSCDGNTACGQACYNAGTDTAKMQWNSLITCGESECNGNVTNAAQYKVCLQQNCTELYNTCFETTMTPGDGTGTGTGTGTGGVTGPGSCAEGYGCIKTCYDSSMDETTFYVCVETCYAALSPEGNAAMDTLTACTDVQCAGVPGDLNNFYQCHQDMCPTQYAACVGTSGGGGGGSVAPPTGGSCAGNCGSGAPEGCYCDDLCSQYGDCCADICDACGLCN